MQTERKLMTAEELLDMPDDSYLYELIEGVLRKMPPPGYDHGRIENLVAFRLTTFVYPRGLGEVLSGDPGFILSRNPDTVRAPDVAFIRKERIPTERMTGYWEGVPDLVMEVVSPSDRHSDVQQKALQWIDAGVPLVWTVDAKTRSVQVYAGRSEVRLLREDDEIDGGEVIPGFRCKVSEFFG